MQDLNAPFLAWGRRPAKSFMRCRCRCVIPREERTSTRCLYGGLAGSVASAPSRFRFKSLMKDIARGETKERGGRRLPRCQSILALQRVGAFSIRHFDLSRSRQTSMAKKARQSPTEPSPGAVPSRDVLQRLNYLYQASTFLAAALAPPARPSPTSAATAEPAFLIPTQVGGAEAVVVGDAMEDVRRPEASTSAASPPREASVVPETKERRKGKGLAKEGLEETCAPPVSRMMIRTMREVAKKAVVRM